MAFGKRAVPPPPPGGGGESAGSPTNRFPWSADSYWAVCNIAFAQYTLMLRSSLSTEQDKHGLTQAGNRFLHAETLIVASGLAAGFAAQSALLFNARSASGAVMRANLHVVQPYADGPRYLFGDPLNQALAPVHGFARGAAVAAGLPPGAFQAIEEAAYKHVANMVKNQTTLFSHGPQHQPLVGPTDLLQKIWPQVRAAMTTVPAPLAHGLDLSGAAWRSRWPLVLAYATGNLLVEARRALDVKVGLALAFESSIYGSKLDPRLVGEEPLPSRFHD